MKKLLTGVLAMFMGLTVAMAQTPATTTQKEAKSKAKTEQKAVKKEAEKKEAAVKKEAGQPAPQASPVAKTEHVTKSGAPDKRFKENKGTTTAPATAGPKKKDGTPDMRYKSNNPNAGKKKS
ncbi:hypothetical protein [Chitinophaga varians]|uniref:hypothetical protein n=1 Tax=Chitinophaga varians TaxID=2202339 RepID=UPI00165F7C47|nr:hypothetical protein [Chitinophaga varians]MBC9910764.1 hypothetical protein [Chitinophaga varians]